MRYANKAVFTVLLAAAGSTCAADRMIVASLGNVNGRVMVNTGNGYVPAKPGMDIAQGDRLITLDGGAAKLVYSDGCVTDLKENNILGVQGAGCQAKPVNPRSNLIRLAQNAPGGTQNDGIPGGGGTVGGTGGTLFGANALILGGAVIGGALLVNQNDDNGISGQ